MVPILRRFMYPIKSSSGVEIFIFCDFRPIFISICKNFPIIAAFWNFACVISEPKRTKAQMCLLKFQKREIMTHPNVQLRSLLRFFFTLQQWKCGYLSKDQSYLNFDKTYQMTQRWQNARYLRFLNVSQDGIGLRYVCPQQNWLQ